jgi:hypothetical protein
MVYIFYLYIEANGQLNRKIMVVREAKPFAGTQIPWESELTQAY